MPGHSREGEARGFRDEDEGGRSGIVQDATQRGYALVRKRAASEG